MWCSLKARVSNLGDLFPCISSGTQEACCSLVPKCPEDSASYAEWSKLRLTPSYVCNPAVPRACQMFQGGFTQELICLNFHEVPPHTHDVTDINTVALIVELWGRGVWAASLRVWNPTPTLYRICFSDCLLQESTAPLLTGPLLVCDTPVRCLHGRSWASTWHT